MEKYMLPKRRTALSYFNVPRVINLLVAILSASLPTTSSFIYHLDYTMLLKTFTDLLMKSYVICHFVMCTLMMYWLYAKIQRNASNDWHKFLNASLNMAFYLRLWYTLRSTCVIFRFYFVYSNMYTISTSYWVS